MVAIGVELNVHRPFARRTELAHELEAFLHGKDIHSVYLDARNGASAHGVVELVAGGTSRLCTHTCSIGEHEKLGLEETEENTENMEAERGVRKRLKRE